MMQNEEYSSVEMLIYRKGLKRFYKVGQVTLTMRSVTDDLFNIVIHSLLHSIHTMLCNLIIFYYVQYEI